MKKIPLLLTFIVFIFCSLNTLQAQIIDSNAYLQTNYLELGINNCGTYVSDQNAPEEYNTSALSITFWEIDSSTIDTVTYIYEYEVWDYDSVGCMCWIVVDTLIDTVVYETYEYIYWYDTLPAPLGIICDVAMDGWDVGSPMLYTGDVTLPGSPEEGFGVEVNGDTYYNSAQSCWTLDIPGDLVSHTVTADTVRTLWEGNVLDHDLSISQESVIPQNKLYFYTNVTLTNNGTETLNDIYYLRNVDPDQEQPWSYDFTTVNTILYNNPTDSQALVMAEGNVYGGNYTIMGTRNANGRVSYGAFLTIAADPISMAYNGTEPFSGEGSMTADIAIQTSFYIPTLEAGASETVSFAYIFSNDADVIEEAMEGTKLVPALPEIECVEATGLSVYELGETTALLNWAIGVEGLEYKIEWRKLGTPTWESMITTDASIMIEGLEPCTYYDYRFTTLCGSGLPSAFASFKTECVTGIDEIVSTEIEIYPNPATDFAIIQFNTNNPSSASIKIADALGKIVYENANLIINQANEISVKELAAGIYSIEINQNGIESNAKLVITK